ncbi:MAG TPA: hypothetical protein VF453_06365 [Burkholderiaceae bacterium]
MAIPDLPPPMSDGRFRFLLRQGTREEFGRVVEAVARAPLVALVATLRAELRRNALMGLASSGEAIEAAGEVERLRDALGEIRPIADAIAKGRYGIADAAATGIRNIVDRALAPAESAPIPEGTSRV